MTAIAPGKKIKDLTSLVTVEVIEDAPILVPNPQHKNFTDSGKRIPKGTTINGQYAICKAMRKGVPFEYRIFQTTDNQIIFQKFIKQNKMETTEVTLGADAQVTPTDIKIPSNATASKAPYVGAALGIIAGLGVAKYQKWSKTHMIVAALVGGAVGFGTGKLIAKKKGVVVKTSK